MDYCRLCARNDKKPLIPILESNPLKLKEKFVKLLNIQVFEASKLPKAICLECLTKLNQFNEFLTTSLENQVILEIIFGEKSEIAPVVPSPPPEVGLKQQFYQEPSSSKQFYVIEEFTSEPQDTLHEQYEHFEAPAEHTDKVEESQDDVKAKLTVAKRKFDRFDCYVCKEQLPGNNKFIQHFAQVHPTEELRYSCYHCSSYVKKYRSYTRHIESHSEKRFACDICDRVFSQKITLAQHLNTHSNISIYKCDECGLSFKQNSSLFKHKKQKHTRHLPSCDECNKSFTSSETLLQHMKSKHNIVKDITCQECLKAFASRSALNYHQISDHKKDNTVRSACEICNKTFKTPIILKRHIKKFHFV